MFGFFGKDKAEKILLPMQGKVMKAADIPDAAFAEEMMGVTLAIEPADGKVYAPFDGTVEAVFETKHALSLTSVSGIELLLHVGIETVKLQGKAFTAYVQSGQQVKKGDLLLEADLAAIKAAGMSTITSVVICNADECNKITKNLQGSKVGDELFTVER